MSSQVTSNQNLGNFGVDKTLVSASSIGEALNSNPAILEGALFNTLVSPPACLSFTGAVAQAYSLTTEDIAAAVTGQLEILTDATATISINLGGAGPALQSLLNLSATHPWVDLNLSVKSTAAAGNLALATGGLAGVSVSGTLFAAASATPLLNRIRVTWVSDGVVTGTAGTARPL